MFCTTTYSLFVNNPKPLKLEFLYGMAGPQENKLLKVSYKRSFGGCK